MQKRMMFNLLTMCLMLWASQSTQAQTILFDLEGRAGSGLLPGNELGSITGGTGGELGGISYDVGSSLLTIDVGWGSGNGFSDLTGSASSMHLHGPADFNSNAGILYALGGLAGFDSSASSGGFDGSLTIAGGDINDLMNGLIYINVHTTANGGGEMRGNLVQAIPEPSSLVIVGISGLAVLARRRRKS